MVEDGKVYEGIVIWFKRRGLGFIEWSIDGVKQKDMFVHYSGIEQEGFRMLKEGQRVSFELGMNYRGQPIAVKVKLIN